MLDTELARKGRTYVFDVWPERRAFLNSNLEAPLKFVVWKKIEKAGKDKASSGLVYKGVTVSIGK